MSIKGLKKVSNIFYEMQKLRIELINEGSKNSNSMEGKQDLKLAVFLQKTIDNIKDEFIQIGLM